MSETRAAYDRSELDELEARVASDIDPNGSTFAAAGGLAVRLIYAHLVETRERRKELAPDPEPDPAPTGGLVITERRDPVARARLLARLERVRERLAAAQQPQPQALTPNAA